LKESTLKVFSEGIKEAACATVEKKAILGQWAFSLDYPSYRSPAMTLCDKSDFTKNNAISMAAWYKMCPKAMN